MRKRVLKQKSLQTNFYIVNRDCFPRKAIVDRDAFHGKQSRSISVWQHVSFFLSKQLYVWLSFNFVPSCIRTLTVLRSLTGEYYKNNEWKIKNLDCEIFFDNRVNKFNYIYICMLLYIFYDKILEEKIN